MKTFSLEHKDPDVFWLRVRLLVRVEFALCSLSFELMLWNWLKIVFVYDKYDKYDKYVIVPVDKTSNNIVFVCKSYYFECLVNELGINSNTSSNTTYKPISFAKDEILANHRSFMTSLNIPSGKEWGFTLFELDT